MLPCSCLASYCFQFLSQDEEKRGLFVRVNIGIVVCLLSSCLSRMKPYCSSDSLPHSPPSHHSFHVNENAVCLLLYQMTRKCVTFTLKHNPPNICQVPLLMWGSEDVVATWSGIWLPWRLTRSFLNLLVLVNMLLHLWNSNEILCDIQLGLFGKYQFIGEVLNQK